jgi:5-methylcytosine-specific restriction endonuclease McrA
MTAEQRTNVQRYVASKGNGIYRKPIDGDKVVCEHCGSQAELEWHHRKYWSEGGDDSPENLQVLCHPCHTAVHRQKDDFRKAGQWGGWVSAYIREQALGRFRFCEEMRALARKRWGNNGDGMLQS